MDRKQLYEGLVRRDERAWRTFLDEYGRLIYSIATRLELDEESRADLFQDTCLLVYESIATLRDPERLASWLYTLTYRLGIDHLRRRRPSVGIDALGPDGAEFEADPGGPDTLERIARLESVAHLMDALARIDRRCRRLLEALYLEDPRPSYEEIGRRERMPIGSIGPTRARCLEKAQGLLSDISKSPATTSADWSRERRSSDRRLSDAGPRFSTGRDI